MSHQSSELGELVDAMGSLSGGPVHPLTNFDTVFANICDLQDADLPQQRGEPSGHPLYLAIKDVISDAETERNATNQTHQRSIAAQPTLKNDPVETMG